MKVLQRLAITILGSILLIPGSQAVNRQYAVDLGYKVIGFFVNRQFDSIYNRLDSTTATLYKAHVFEKDWTELTGTYGKYVSNRLVNYDENSGYSFLGFEVKFEYLPYVLNLTVMPAGKLSQVSFVPAHKVYVAPPYCNLLKFHEEQVPFGGDPYLFKGVLTRPDTPAKVPLVVIVNEAGPTDKDFTFDINRPYKDLAWGLASQGFAVFRYDKRSSLYGMMMAGGKMNYVPFTCREEYLVDLYAALDTLEKRTDLDFSRLFILGHGEGGILGPIIAKERKEVKGIIMMGANSYKTQEMMIQQYAYLSRVTPGKKDEYDEQTRKAKYSMRKNLYEYELMDSMPYGVQPSYWIWLNRYDHVQMAKDMKNPLLILHGERDYQVNMDNYELWKKRLKKKKNVTFRLYPKLNHMFYEGGGESTYSEYYIRSNIPEYVINDIVSWMKAQ
jgi:hypothetical protein